MIDRADIRLLAKGAIVFALGSSFVLGIAAVVGLAWRILMLAAG